MNFFINILITWKLHTLDLEIFFYDCRGGKIETFNKEIHEKSNRTKNINKKIFQNNFSFITAYTQNQLSITLTCLLEY